jgi:diguanylate cyclase (GGDEF)-like protein
MTAFDSHSFVLISSLLGSLCAIVLWILRRSVANEIGGVGLWSKACWVGVVGGLALTLKGFLPYSFAVFVSNFSLVCSLMLMLCSLRAFAGRLQPNRSLLSVLGGYGLLLLWFAVVAPDLRIRVAISCVVCGGILLVCAWDIYRMSIRSAAEIFTGTVFATIGVLTVLRTMSIVTGIDQSSQFYTPQTIAQIYQVIFAVGIIALTLGFILMVGNKLHSTLIFLASRDSQTGAFSRGVFFDHLTRELTRTQRTSAPLALMMIDLDNFKSINDTWGHPVGDMVIADFIRIVKSTLRSYDVLGRYGGDEFAILLPDTGIDEASMVAERIRTQCAESAAEGRPAYTVSIGICGTIDGVEAMEVLLATADRALYRAKEGGKNRIEPQAAMEFDADLTPA